MSVNTHLHVRDVMKLRYVMKLCYVIMLWRYVFATHNDQIQVFFLQNALVEYIGVYSDTNKKVHSKMLAFMKVYSIPADWFDSERAVRQPNG